jgi:hypothetical protein
MNQQYSLETVATNFKQWRVTRRSNRETTPTYLQKQVVALHNHGVFQDSCHPFLLLHRFL